MGEVTEFSDFSYDPQASLVVDDIFVHYQTKRFGSGGRTLFGGAQRGRSTTTEALRSISFVAYRGDSIGIIGRNGSGKSTLMRVLAGLTAPTTGAVYATSPPVLLGVNAALVPSLSGAQNIRLGCLAMGMRPDQIAEKYDSIVELSGLEDEINYPMNSYSSGMGSRLRFAIAAAVDPEILLIDEALNTGDAQFRDRSKQRIDEIRELAGTVFLVSHSLDTIVDSCNRCIWLDKGDFIMDGDTETVTQEYKNFVWRMKKGDPSYGRQVRAELMASRPPLQTKLLKRGWRSSRRRNA